MPDLFMFRTRLAELESYASELNVEKASKVELGTLGFPELAGVIGQLKREILVMADVSNDASGNQLRTAINSYTEYFALLYKIAYSSPQEFANQRGTFEDELASKWDAVRESWVPFAALAVAKSGLVYDPEAFQRKIDGAAQAGEASIRAISKEMLDRAEQEAKRIEANARMTAQGFSVKAAQDQFDAASKALNTKALVCGGSALICFAIFIGFAFHVYRNPPIASTTPLNTVQAVYLTAIRITILTAIGALTTFFLKMLRAYLHMSEFNDHRRRVANSMAAFVESAQSAEQRDQIFGRLVDSIVYFGDSGILNKESEGISVPSVVIDAVTKNLAPKSN